MLHYLTAGTAVLTGFVFGTWPGCPVVWILTAVFALRGLLRLREEQFWRHQELTCVAVAKPALVFALHHCKARSRAKSYSDKSGPGSRGAGFPKPNAS